MKLASNASFVLDLDAAVSGAGLFLEQDDRGGAREREGYRLEAVVLVAGGTLPLDLPSSQGAERDGKAGEEVWRKTYSEEKED